MPHIRIQNRDLNFHHPLASQARSQLSILSKETLFTPYHDSYFILTALIIIGMETVNSHNFSLRSSILFIFYFLVFVGASSLIRFAIIILNGVRKTPLYYTYTIRYHPFIVPIRRFH